jgi:creatinine amidohydrolase/Fe(II)-dependent formamide hydrolase-like protein
MNSIYIDQKHRFLPYLTSLQLEQLPDKDKAVIILPIASIEQHGPHLPAYTDSILGLETLNRALSRLPDDFPAWFLPLLPYGKSNEHAELAGTFTLSTQTCIQVLMEIGRSVANNGFKRLAIFNSHGGNNEIVDLVIRDLRQETDLYLFGLHTLSFCFDPPLIAGLSEDEKLFGIHAGYDETSSLLHICPELVNMNLAPESIPHYLKSFSNPPFMGKLNFAWMITDLTSTGMVGNAKTADAARGDQSLSYMADELADLFHKINAFEFKP